MMDDIVKHPSLETFPYIKYTLIGKKQIKIFYEIKKNEIVIKLFWHGRQDPIRLKNILNENKKSEAQNFTFFVTSSRILQLIGKSQKYVEKVTFSFCRRNFH